MKSHLIGVLAAVVIAGPAVAQEYDQYPAQTPYYPFQRSCLKRGIVIVPPYNHPFRVRSYTTPPQTPYYNVPPYDVITPF